MIERILGIDAGTNSMGWAVVDYDSEKAEEEQYWLIDKGVHIFPEGVPMEENKEKSLAAERTGHRRLRIGYWRRKCRKIALLKVLIQHDLCPALSPEELKRWRQEKQYPLNEAFMLWLRTDEATHKNPYYCRHRCLTETLDLSRQDDRHTLGRALYHLNQRRGFLSNRKDEASASDGAVQSGIDELTAAMAERGIEYLGEYFYTLYENNEKIRKQYTSRLAHYEKELLQICAVQHLDAALTDLLRRVIITQRPLRSQKHTVGHCVFEPQKTRCPQSHPLYEQYRMYAFINNIKMQGPHDEELRPLSPSEKETIIPLFLRKSKKEFPFSDIAKKLSGKSKDYGYYKDGREHAYRYNFYMDTSVSGCPVITQLSEVFAVEAPQEGSIIDEWVVRASEGYTAARRSNGTVKSRYEIMNDIWHALFFFDDDDKLTAWAQEKLQLDAAAAKTFSKIRIPTTYASLSLKAIRKILPYMKEYGMIYSHAVFLANLSTLLYGNSDMLPRAEADEIVQAFHEYGEQRETAITREEYLRKYIKAMYHLSDEEEKVLHHLYHPSMIETFPKVRVRHYETPQLASPRTSSLRNPMAMRALFRLRHVVNTLLREGKIDQDTILRIEFARELNDANRRAAIRQYQRDREAENKKYIEEIKKYRGENYTPSADEVLKYRLWEEQNHSCLYTGKEIGIADLFDGNKCDIEHTIPRSKGGESTAVNLTLCDTSFNRSTKRNQLPTALANHEEIMERIAHWKEKYEDLEKQLRKLNTRGIADKEVRDRIIRKKHRLSFERDYWRSKYERFTIIKDSDDAEKLKGFSRRQGVDVSIISKYARQYLKSLFYDRSGNREERVFVVKGAVTADFRKIWGLQEEDEKKERDNYCHHAIDAVTIACIGPAEHAKLARFHHEEEDYSIGLKREKPHLAKPWRSFTEDMKHLEETLLVSHYTADNMGKQTRKRQRIRGKWTGKYIQGHTARAALHQDTYYGAICREGEVRYVVRRPLDTLDEKNVKNIVDNAVRQKVEEAIAAHKSLKEAVSKGIWMNEEKKIPIKKVRVYTPSVRNPLQIRQQRDLSPKEYKRPYYVVNDSNYMIGIYVGRDNKGKEKRYFELINSLEATKLVNDKKRREELLPTEKNGCTLRYKLKIGTMVLLYEKTPDEVYKADMKELRKRLYKVTGMSSMKVGNNYYGRLVLTYHQEGRSSTEIKAKNGVYKQGEKIRPQIAMLHTQINALVEGQDFTMNELGEITFYKYD